MKSNAIVIKMTPAPKLWVPKNVQITLAAQQYPLTRNIAERASALGANIIELRSDRLQNLKGTDERETYINAKTTLAVVVSPPSHRTLQPIPPSADWQFHIARGCPAHCQYCYLAGSLPGPPLTRVYANLDEILEGLGNYVGKGTVTSKSKRRADEGTTFEASCYTDPLALEHLTGSLAETIDYFGRWNDDVQLRWTTKFDNVDSILSIAHNRHTRVRISVNARPITTQFEGGTSSLDARIKALGKLARANYPIGLTVAPIMPILDWQQQYTELFELVRSELNGVEELDLTVELITHRFTPTSKSILTGWYPASRLEMDESLRDLKRTKFNTTKYVYPKSLMKDLHDFFREVVTETLPVAKILYWT